MKSSQRARMPFALSGPPGKLGGRVLLLLGNQEGGGEAEADRCWGRNGPRWLWVAESHLPPVPLWCTFRRVKRITKSVAVDGDMSVSETKEAAPNLKPQTSHNTGTRVSSGF